MQSVLVLLAVFGAFAGLRLSLSHLQTGEVCPMLGPLPACIVVFFGYLFVSIAALNYAKLWSKKLFYIGWTPVFLLAFFGVILELTYGQTCPPGPAGVPQCFISLGMASIAWGLFRMIRKSATSSSDNL